MADFSLKSIAYRAIKEKILDCQIEGGTRIREDLLAEELEMSRTPVREAINQLIMEGLVKSVPRKGLYCIEITPDMIYDLCDCRVMFEIYAVRRCAERGTEHQFRILEEIAENLKTAKSASESIDDLFHLRIMEFCGNAQLLKVYPTFSNNLHILRVMTKLYPALPNHRLTSSKDHDEIISCLRRHDADAAEAVMRGHIERMRDHLLHHGAPNAKDRIS